MSVSLKAKGRLNLVLASAIYITRVYIEAS